MMNDEDLDQLLIRAKPSFRPETFSISKVRVWQEIESRKWNSGVSIENLIQGFFNLIPHFSPGMRMAIWGLFLLSCMGIGGGSAMIYQGLTSSRSHPHPVHSEGAHTLHERESQLQHYVHVLHPGIGYPSLRTTP